MGPSPATAIHRDPPVSCANRLGASVPAGPTLLVDSVTDVPSDTMDFQTADVSSSDSTIACL